MKFFVSTSFDNRAAAVELMKLLTAAGHTLTHDWTGESVDGLWGKAREEYLVRCALEDRKGVKAADVLIALAHQDGKGMFVEMGIAIAHDIPIVVVNRERAEQVFYALPNHYFVDTLEQAVEKVKWLADRDARIVWERPHTEVEPSAPATPLTAVTEEPSKGAA